MKGFLWSFYHAFSGICYLVKNERNFKIHLTSFTLVILAGFYFKITNQEWINVLGISGLVMSLEAINTSIERMSDMVSKDQNHQIKIIKDVSAGAVLIASILAVIIGVLVFWKYISLLIF